MDWHLRQPGNEEPPCAYERVHGCSLWDSLRSDPAAEASFSRGMTSADAIGLPTLLKDFPWAKFRRVIDVGGAGGSVLAAVLKAHPRLEGVLFDQPQVTVRADTAWKERPDWHLLSGRIQMVGGSFFEAGTLPRGQDGDLFFLRCILHDWDDRSSLDILRALRKAAGRAHVTIAVCELALIPEHTTTILLSFRYVIDMLMHGVVRGKERTKQQLEDLLSAAGFRFVRAHETRNAMHVIEAVTV